MTEDQFLAEIRMFAGNFAPSGWAFCNGQILPIAQYTALFSLMGTTYGGNGQTTFALPDLRMRAPLHHGAGNGLSNRLLGESGGTATVSLTAEQIPAHSHTMHAVAAVASTTLANGNLLATVNAPNPPYHDPTMPGAMGPGVLGPNGSSSPHDNMQPYMTVSFIIALQGIFPPHP